MSETFELRFWSPTVSSRRGELGKRGKWASRMVASSWDALQMFWEYKCNHGWQSEICCQKEHRSSRRTSARISKTCRGKFFFFPLASECCPKHLSYVGGSFVMQVLCYQIVWKLLKNFFFHQFYPHKLMNL